MTLARNQLELLAPARDVEIAKEAVLHGADAVYIGGPAFGARTKADNTIKDIAELVTFAHRFRVKIFVTVNTIVHDSELELARTTIHQLWDAGVDALIVQDMGILELDIPPIALHASTQCDIRTVEKAQFLSHVGFSQLVLAREMTLQDIIATRAAINPDVALEFFVHGALCVAFSGNCYISHAHTGRSANRGACAQECRLPYTLKDGSGRVVAFDKHLLSLKDNDQSANMRALIDAGIRSFKIEGRYKDMRYVKNITAHYRQLLDDVLNERPELARCSDGASSFTFTPHPEKTFNRSSTDYFVHGRKEDIGAFDAPAHFGPKVGTITRVLANGFDIESTEPLANGDGLTYMHKRDVRGMQVNVATLLSHHAAQFFYRVTPNQPMANLAGLQIGTTIHRNRDHAWEAALAKPSATRKISVGAAIQTTTFGSDSGISFGLDAVNGEMVVSWIEGPFALAQNPDAAKQQIVASLLKTGNTAVTISEMRESFAFVPHLKASQVNDLRRRAIEGWELARARHYQRPMRMAATEPPAQYPESAISFLANVYNQRARDFYTKHGVQLIASAYETHEEPGEVPLMITKHCLRFSFNLCPKQAKGVTGVQGQVRAEPMILESAGETLTLKFDCKPCEMHVVGKMKSSIFKSLPPSIAHDTDALKPLTFFKKKPEPLALD